MISVPIMNINKEFCVSDWPELLSKAKMLRMPKIERGSCHEAVFTSLTRSPNRCLSEKLFLRKDRS